MRKTLLWAFLSVSLALGPLCAHADDAGAMAAATELRVFEFRFEAADREALITTARSRSLREQLDALKSLYHLTTSPDGSGLSAEQGRSLKLGLDLLSRRLFRS